MPVGDLVVDGDRVDNERARVLAVDQRHRRVDGGNAERLSSEELGEVQVAGEDAAHRLTRAVVTGEHHLVLEAGGLEGAERTHRHVVAEGVHTVEIRVGGQHVRRGGERGVAVGPADLPGDQFTVGAILLESGDEALANSDGGLVAGQPFDERHLSVRGDGVRHPLADDPAIGVEVEGDRGILRAAWSARKEADDEDAGIVGILDARDARLTVERVVHQHVNLGSDERVARISHAGVSDVPPCEQLDVAELVGTRLRPRYRSLIV